MLSISEALLYSRLNSSCALVPFVTAGYPSLDSTIKILNLLDRRGADVIELGIPYSDSLADGPIIQKAAYLAIKQKAYLENVLDIVRKVSPFLNAPIVIFTYYNLVLSRGANVFIKNLYLSGAKGLIIPDLPVEEADYLLELCSKYSIELILFVSPSSSKSRIQAIASKSPGCIYLVSSYGVTGVRSTIQNKLQGIISYIKESTGKMIMLGFGVSDEIQVSKLVQWDIDAVVIGSAFIQKITDNLLDENYADIENFCQKIKYATNVRIK